MRLLGRKIYLNWGAFVVAIEVLPNVSPASLGMLEGPDEGKVGHVVVADVYECMGERLEQIRGVPLSSSRGKDLDSYMCEKDHWLMPGEDPYAGRKRD